MECNYISIPNHLQPHRWSLEMDNFTSHFIMDLFIYPYWDKNLYPFVNGALVGYLIMEYIDCCYPS